MESTHETKFMKELQDSALSESAKVAASGYTQSDIAMHTAKCNYDATEYDNDNFPSD